MGNNNVGFLANSNVGILAISDVGYGMGYDPVSFAGLGGTAVYLFRNSMLLKHDNKIVAVIHLAGSFVMNGNGEIIQDVYVESVTCK